MYHGAKTSVLVYNNNQSIVVFGHRNINQVLGHRDFKLQTSQQGSFHGHHYYDLNNVIKPLLNQEFIHEFRNEFSKPGTDKWLSIILREIRHLLQSYHTFFEPVFDFFWSQLLSKHMQSIVPEVDCSTETHFLIAICKIQVNFELLNINTSIFIARDNLPFLYINYLPLPYMNGGKTIKSGSTQVIRAQQKKAGKKQPKSKQTKTQQPKQFKPFGSGGVVIGEDESGNKWRCQVCTFLNNDQSASCSVCGAQRK